MTGWAGMEHGHPALWRSPIGRRGYGHAVRRCLPRGCPEPGRYVAGRVGPDFFVADGTPCHSHFTQTALVKTLKPLVVHCQGTCALVKFHLRLVAALCELWAKILALQERHCLQYQRNCAMGAV